MTKKRMKLLLLIMLPIALYGLYVVGVLLYGTLTDYKPDAVATIPTANEQELAPTDSSFLFMIWNVGFAGLGAEADFFYDGGKMVRSEQHLVKDYFEGIKNTLGGFKEVDFFLLQEVDLNAKRSYGINEFEGIGELFPEHSRSHALNFNVKYIPKPLLSTSPLGHVKSGLASYSRYKVTETTRYQFPGNFEWPKSVFMLDRCFMLQRVPVANGKDLVIINSHNSAYDDGSLKQQQMDYLKDILLKEYELGNYVVVGADWNQCPPGFAYDKFAVSNSDDYSQSNIPADYLPSDWQWVYDENVATNRKLSTPFTKGETFTTLIDFYLVSPNIEVGAVFGINYDFKNSDHQPVLLNIKLK